MAQSIINHLYALSGGALIVARAARNRANVLVFLFDKGLSITSLNICLIRCTGCFVLRYVWVEMSYACMCSQTLLCSVAWNKYAIHSDLVNCHCQNGLGSLFFKEGCNAEKGFKSSISLFFNYASSCSTFRRIGVMIKVCLNVETQRKTNKDQVQGHIF